MPVCLVLQVELKRSRVSLSSLQTLSLDWQSRNAVLSAKSSDELPVVHCQAIIIFNEVLIFEIELLLPILKNQLFSLDTLILLFLCI